MEYGTRATGFGVVIPVAPQPEPAEFDTRVRKRGDAWILKKGLARNAPLPKGMTYPKNPAYWAKQKDGYSCLEQLYQAYGKICAYTGLRLSIGAKSVDHFVPNRVWLVWRSSGTITVWHVVTSMESKRTLRMYLTRFFSSLKRFF